MLIGYWRPSSGRLPQDGTEQQARLAIDDPLDPADPAQHLVKVTEAFRAQLGHKIPTAICGVQCPNLRKSPELANDFVSRSSFHGNERNGANGKWIDLVAHSRGE